MFGELFKFSFERMGLGFCFLADEGLKLFFIGCRFAVDIKYSAFGGLCGEVVRRELFQFEGDFVVLLLFQELFPCCDKDGLSSVF